ncbi:MAG TPA: 30S ribosomal protein S20 [Candidatus Babeliales bacterium]|jgi:small subunit ribosomal protein S20|nr:30S ribosomal protein S20 [Candidatus Babeliales bacterium]
MANIKSSKKRVLQTAKRQLRNQARKSSIKTAVKRVVAAIESSDIDAAKSLLIAAESKIARAKGKGLLHGNTAARKISKLAQKVAAASRTA